MKNSVRNKLEITRDRYEEVAGLLADPDVISDQNQFRELSREYSRIDPIIVMFREFESLSDDLSAAQEMVSDEDAEIRQMGEEESTSLLEKQGQILVALQKALIPPDPHDDSNIYLEIRAGTGGDEAAIFAGDLFRMYSRYTESQRWSLEIISAREGDHGGYKEIVCRISGSAIFARLKFESGAHRVQRVPATESQGRIHTSACTVAVLPEPDAVEETEINSGDLRVDTYRASGAGGQHVNVTDSAVRITHIPTNIVVQCQKERSQHKNKATAMKLLKSRMYEKKRREQEAELMKSYGDKKKIEWGSQIRSYVLHPYKMVKDLRTGHETGNPQAVLNGKLDPFIEAYLRSIVGEQKEPD